MQDNKLSIAVLFTCSIGLLASVVCGKFPRKKEVFRSVEDTGRDYGQTTPTR